MTANRLATTYEVVAEDRGGILADVREIVRDYWAYRELLQQFVLRDIRIRYKQALMGFGWAVLMPFLIVLAGVVVRFAMAHLAGGALDTVQLGGLAVRALPWAFFVGSIGFANVSLIGNSSLVTKIYFPREVLPLSAVVAQAFDLVVGAAALVVLMPFLGGRLTLALLWVPVLLLLIFCQTWALALFVSAANLFFRDVKYIVQVMLTFGIFFTPVFFEPGMLGARGARAAMLNPLAPLLEGLRLATVEGHGLLTSLHSGNHVLLWSPWDLAYSLLWAVVGLVAASVLFHRLEKLFAEYV